MASDVNDTMVANNNQNDNLIEIENDEISVERNNEFIGFKDFENDSFRDNLDILGSSESQEEISLDNNSDVLSTKSPSSDDYSVHVTSTVLNIGDSSGTITVYIDTPCNLAGYYKYHFKLNIRGSNGNGYSKEYYSTSSTSPVKYTFDPKKFGVGTHDIVIQNCGEPTIMAKGTITIKDSSSSSNPSKYPSSSAYSVSVSDATLKYGSSGSISMSISPASSSTYKYYYTLKVYDSNNNVRISQVYSGTSAAYSKTYSVGSNELSAGTYTVKIINYAPLQIILLAFLILLLGMVIVDQLPCPLLLLLKILINTIII